MTNEMKIDNVTELWKRYRQGVDYQNKIGIRTQIPKNVDMYEGRQWPKATEATKNLPRPVINIIKMICRNKKAAILSSKVRLVYKSDDADADVEKFNNFSAFIEKEIGQIELDKQAVEDGIKKGSYFYHYYWDVNAEGKDADVSGALRCELIDPLNIFFANPCELDEQKQDWIIVVTRESVNAIKAKADSDVKDEDIIPDELLDDGYGTQEQDNGQLCTVITCYERQNGIVTCQRATKTTVINKPFNIVPTMKAIDDANANSTLKKKRRASELYPIVAGFYEKRDRCIYGLSEVEGLISNQKAVNFHIAMCLLNGQENAWGKYVVLPNALNGQKITNIPGQVLVDYSGTGSGIRKMTEQAIHNLPLEIVSTLVNLTRSASGATEVMTGETIGANMSGAAIAQLQAQATVPIEDLRDTFWLVKKKQGKVLAQFYKHFYMGADFTYKDVSDADEETVVSDAFDSSQYSNVDFDIVVEATQGSRSSAASDISMLDALLSGGHIDVDSFIESYPDDCIGNKSEIIKAIKKEKESKIASLTEQLNSVNARAAEYEQVIKSQEAFFENVAAVVRECRNLKELLAEVASEEIALSEEAQAKINEANKKILDQNEFIKGLMGAPRDAVPQKQVDIANG